MIFLEFVTPPQAIYQSLRYNKLGVPDKVYLDQGILIGCYCMQIDSQDIILLIYLFIVHFHLRGFFISTYSVCFKNVIYTCLLFIVWSQRRLILSKSRVQLHSVIWLCLFLVMFPPDPVCVDARRWSGLRYTRDCRRDSSTNHRCAKIGCNRAQD